MWGIVLIIILFILILLWFAIFVDADLTLLFYEKFGPKPDLHNKVVWITGASSGIGEHLSYDCIRLGSKLVISGVNTDRLKEVREKCLMINPEAEVLILPFLMQDFDIHENCLEKVIQYFGHIDILVNNAGMSQKANFADINIDVDKKLFDVNVFGTVNLTRKVLKYFVARKKGMFVVTSSMAGKIGAPFSSSYTGSKHALHGYFEGLRMEMAKIDIDICIVCPGPVFSNLRSRCATETLGKIHNEEQPDSARKMKTERCSHLITIAIANKLTECWICFQPMLFLYYLSQYFPGIMKSIFIKYFFNPETAVKYRSGSE